MTGHPHPDAPEFSWPVPVEEIEEAESLYELEPGPAERDALARRFGLLGIPALRATVRLNRLKGGRFVRLRAAISGEAVQTCVVTLEPVPSKISEDIEILYDTQPDEAPDETVMVDEDEPEPLEGEALDLGEIVAEEFALMLDPYPRAPGADLGSAGLGPGGGDKGPPGPFEILARLKRTN